MPLLVPSATGLANSGSGKSTCSASAGCWTTAKSGVGIPCCRTTALVRPFVQSQREDQRIGERIGDVVDVEDRRHLRLAGRPAVKTLGDVEHQIPAVARGQPLD